jgi:iduronate 2-sulfatase
LIVAPGQGTSGGIANSPVSHIDLFPTLAELCGIEAPSNLQGQSLAPMLRDQSATGRGWAISQVTRPRSERRRNATAGTRNDGPFFGYSLRTPRWRYTEWAEGRQGRELYDHEADPRELTNLADDPVHAVTVEKLSRQLRNAVRATFPPSGETPAIQPGLWAPILTDP